MGSEKREQVEQLELALEDAENFLRGLWLDPNIPGGIKATLMSKAEGIRAALRRIDPGTYAD